LAEFKHIIYNYKIYHIGHRTLLHSKDSIVKAFFI